MSHMVSNHFLVSIITANASDYIYYAVYKIYYNPSLSGNSVVAAAHGYKQNTKKIEKMKK